MLYDAVSQIIDESVMSIYSDKLARKQVVINCPYSVAQMCTCEDMLSQYLGALYLDDVMSNNELTTTIFR